MNIEILERHEMLSLTCTFSGLQQPRHATVICADLPPLAFRNTLVCHLTLSEDLSHRFVPASACP